MTTGSDADEELLAGYAEELIRAVDRTLAPWVVRSVEQRMTEFSGSCSDEVRDLAVAAGERARSVIGRQVAELLRQDIDEQRVTPLSILRTAVTYPSGVLEAAGVPHVQRDEIDERLVPADVYGLSPASFADVDPLLHEPGMAWGAAKAYVHLARHRAEGQR